MRANELASRLAQESESVAELLLPNGKRQGTEWQVGSLGGEAGKSLRVKIQGDKAGVWKDFATGDGGDLVGLWCKVHNLTLADGMREISEYLGIREDHPKDPVHVPDLVAPPSIPDPENRVWRWLESRGLTRKSLAAYGVKANESEAIFPSEVNGKVAWIKYRHHAEKSRMRVEKGSVPVLFGWQAVPQDAREIIVCEGEIDALSWYEMGYPALSVPSGAQGLNWVENEYDRLDRFDVIYIAFDADIEGRKGGDALAARLGVERCRMIDTGVYKDANELLQGTANGKDYVEHAHWNDPEELKSAHDFEQELFDLSEHGLDSGPGFNTPWDKLNNRLRFREAELTVLNGVNGHGKSQLCGQIVLSALEQNQRCVIASMELKPKNLLWKMAWQAAEGGLTKPKIASVLNWLKDKLWLFDLVGTAKTDRLLEVFEYARKRYDCRLFVVDSLLKCGIAEDDYNGQKRFVEALTDFKNRFDCHVILVTHSRKGEDEKKPTGKMDVRGTGAITDLADTVLTIWRNKRKEEAKNLAEMTQEPVKAEIHEEPDALMYTNKQRNGDWEGVCKLWWHRGSTQFVGEESARPHKYAGLRAVE